MNFLAQLFRRALHLDTGGKTLTKDEMLALLFDKYEEEHPNELKLNRDSIQDKLKAMGFSDDDASTLGRESLADSYGLYEYTGTESDNATLWKHMYNDNDLWASLAEFASTKIQPKE